MGVGRPRKYREARHLSIYIPREVWIFLRDLSLKTGRSINDLVVEALLSYYKEVRIGNIRVREREKRAIDVMRELEIKRIEKELKAHESDVERLEQLRAQNIMYVNYRGMSIYIWDAIVRKQNSLHGLMKKIVGLEKYGLDLYKYAEKVRELIERLEKIK